MPFFSPQQTKIKTQNMSIKYEDDNKSDDSTKNVLHFHCAKCYTELPPEIAMNNIVVAKTTHVTGGTFIFCESCVVGLIRQFHEGLLPCPETVKECRARDEVRVNDDE